MSDLPTQALLQQTGARHVTGEHLEVLGKQASVLWATGRASNLNDAVVATVKTAGLSPEQVRRVVEFTNTAAYLSEFAKEGSQHRVIDFGSDGPANPARVLQDLNDGGGGSSYDSGDYRSPPPRTKSASAWEETAFQQMFKTEGSGGYADANPLGEVIDLRDKLAGQYETATSELSSMELGYSDLCDSLFFQVKQAAMEGHDLSEVVEIWSRYAPHEEYIKVAFAEIGPRLVENEVFRTHSDYADSLMKKANVGLVNPDHPLVSEFGSFCEVLSKLAETREVQQELGEGVARLTSFLKEAAAPKGLINKAVGVLGSAADHSRTGAHALGEAMFGEGSAHAATLGNVAHKGVKYVAPALAANEVYRHTKYNPVLNSAMGYVPGTREYYQREQELQQRAAGY